MINLLSPHAPVPDPVSFRAPPSRPDFGLADRGLAMRTGLALAVVAILVFGIGGWSAIAKISGAVIASGTIVVDNNIKKVQHPTGGIVGEIRVKNGDRVEPDQLLIRLDETQTRAALGIITSQLIELQGRKARLAAERDDAPAIVFPSGFEKLGGEAVRVAKGERALLDSRRRSIAGQKGQLKERIKQLALEAQGLTSQHRAKSSELELVREELARVRDMHKRSLTPITRLLAIQRDETRSEGEHGSLMSQIGRVGGQAAEVELQILNLDQSVRTDAQKELREVEGRIAELEERRIAAEDQLKRIEIRAPQAGVVHELAVNTIGGVIGAAETLMLIVPIDETLAVEVRFAPQDIDQVTLGQKTLLRFVAFNQRTTPELPGIVRLAADLSREAQTNSMFYVARIGIDPSSIAQLGKLKLVPGMPVEAYISTGERTALSYLIKPITDHIHRVFRED
jgi:HlyD family secretion protein